MQQIRYNTPEHRKLYKEHLKAYEGINTFEVIEGRVRMLSKLIYESGLGVTIYSCEGHHDTAASEFGSGYVMMVAKNRDAATKLVEWFQECSAYVVERLGWEGQPAVETNIAYLEENVGFSCIVVRSPDMSVELCDRFWVALTKRFYNLAKPYMACNPNIKEAA